MLSETTELPPSPSSTGPGTNQPIEKKSVEPLVGKPNDAESLFRVIEAKSGWKVIDFAELWRFRELLMFMIWRDITVRYKQTVLGASWAIIQPLTQMIVFSIFFGRLAELRSDGIGYPLFAFAGLMPWTFFTNSVTSSSGSVVSNQNLITKVYFPRLFVPASAIGVGLADFAVAFVLVPILMYWYSATPSASILALPLIIIGLTALSFGVGALIAALTVAYRDFRHVVPFMVQIWMFATPSIYMDASILGPNGKIWLPLNPAYGLIQNFRYSLLGHPLNTYSLSVSLAMTLVILIVGCLYFRRVEQSFADVI